MELSDNDLEDYSKSYWQAPDGFELWPKENRIEFYAEMWVAEMTDWAIKSNNFTGISSDIFLLEPTR